MREPARQHRLDHRHLPHCLLRRRERETRHRDLLPSCPRERGQGDGALGRHVGGRLLQLGVAAEPEAREAEGCVRGCDGDARGAVGGLEVGARDDVFGGAVWGDAARDGDGVVDYNEGVVGEEVVGANTGSGGPGGCSREVFVLEVLRFVSLFCRHNVSLLMCSEDLRWLRRK